MFERKVYRNLYLLKKTAKDVSTSLTVSFFKKITFNTLCDQFDDTTGVGVFSFLLASLKTGASWTIFLKIGLDCNDLACFATYEMYQ